MANSSESLPDTARRKPFWSGPAWLLLIAALMIALGGPWIARRMEFAGRLAATEESRLRLTHDQLKLQTLSESFRTLARAVEESVVHIRVFSDRTAETGTGAGGSIDGSMEVSSGSGWVYRAVTDGDPMDVIITNHHVVANAERIRVRFRNRQEVSAELLGSDARTDIAVLKVNTPLIPAEVAPLPAEQGDLVFAFGSPFGYEFSMSQGIVSATGRHPRRMFSRLGGYENYIQTDTAINPGNSGGPLTNVVGQVVGMNTAIRPRMGDNAFAGVGFAIPVARITYIADQLVRHGKVERGFLGVQIRAVEADEASRLGHLGTGVMVTEAMTGFAASQAGVRSGDLIVEVDGRPVFDDQELRNLVADLMPGTIVELAVIRGGDRQTLPVELSVMPGDERLADLLTEPDRPRPTGPELLSRLGLNHLRDLNEADSQRLLADGTPGVLAQSIMPGSPAEAALIQPGMLISEVDGRPVRNQVDLARELARFEPGQTVRLTVRVASRVGHCFLRIPPWN